ncbi:MAG: efflux RND transporter periplasmic adaptor subunit [Rhabdochlamydiaceae bacterium]
MKWAYWTIPLLLLGCSKKEVPPPTPPYVTTGQASSQNVPFYFEYVGHVEAYQSVEIKAQVTGLINGQYFTEGQEVKAGDLLVTIDDRPFRAALSKAEAELAQNIATLRQARETVERYSLLVKESYISQLDYDQFVTNVYTGEAAIKQNYADIETATINLNYCTITAPITGVTSKLLINVGNYIPVGGENPLMSINQVKPIKVEFNAPEKDLPYITLAQSKEPLKVIAYLQGAPIEGKLHLIDNQVNTGTGMILLQAVFPNEDMRLWPGEFVDVRVIVEIKKDATVIPAQAVLLGQDGPYVYVLTENRTVELRPVLPGLKEGSMVVIDKGVFPGETVIIEGQINLSPGASVSIKNKI